MIEANNYSDANEAENADLRANKKTIVPLYGIFLYFTTFVLRKAHDTVSYENLFLFPCLSVPTARITNSSGRKYVFPALQ